MALSGHCEAADPCPPNDAAAVVVHVEIIRVPMSTATRFVGGDEQQGGHRPLPMCCPFAFLGQQENKKSTLTH